MVRRLFSLTDIFDSWKTGQPIDGKSKAASLRDVTLYTSLKSCAQCSGVMSLGGVKQIVYLQNDFTAYKIGNIMFDLAKPVGRRCRGRQNRLRIGRSVLKQFQAAEPAPISSM